MGSSPTLWCLLCCVTSGGLLGLCKAKAASVANLLLILLIIKKMNNDYAAQAELQLVAILLLQHPKCLDCRYVLITAVSL